MKELDSQERNQGLEQVSKASWVKPPHSLTFILNGGV
jgi:hypothetical protein